MTLIWTIVVPRELGPAGLGTIVAAWSVTGILGTILGLGTRTYLVREIVVDRPQAPQLIGTAIILRGALAPVFLAGAIIYDRLAGYGHSATTVLYLASAATVLTLLAEPLQAGFQATERMEYLAYSDVINKSAQGLIGVTLALIGFRSVGITACWTVVAGVVLAADAYWLRGHLRVDLRTSARRLANMTRHSVAYWAYGVFFMVYLWIDSVMLSLMTHPAVVGWYGVPTRLFQTLMFVPVVVSTAWLPRLVVAFGGGLGRLRDAARAPIELVLVTSLPICAATAIGAKPVIHLLYGPTYAHAVPVLVILAFCVPPMYLNIMLNQVLVAAKRQVVWTWVMVGATIANPLLNFVLIRATQARYANGAIGAALSLLVTEVLIVTVGVVMVGRGVLDRRSVRRCLLALSASVEMWAAAYAARPLGSVASIASGAATFVLLAAIIGFLFKTDAAPLRDGAALVFGRMARSVRSV